MIKVLIVEDDKLVRKNIISSFEWEKFNMVIVGEAKNGEKALQFIGEHDVNLIITDLAMPIMSGIELIRIVKREYPTISVVVLSHHLDFEYIQEALRLGAIDYIAKIELDENSINDSLYRIQERVEKEFTKRKVSVEKESEDGYGFVSSHITHCKDVLLEIIEEHNLYPINDLSLIVSTKQYKIAELVQLLIDSRREIRPLLCITPNTNQEFIEMKKLIDKQADQLLFYETNQEKQIVSVNFNQLLQPSSAISLSTSCRRKIHSLEWVSNQENLEGMLQEMKEAYLTKSQLEDFLLWTIDEWKRIYGDLLPSGIDLPKEIHYWNEIEKWFIEVKYKIYGTMFSHSYSTETNQCIIQAVALIEKELASSLTANDIALRVNMSRSYFSRCFKEIVGHTFNEYIRIIRINKAKQYLLFTKEKIGVIAEKVGYTDIKYFSKLFRNETGLLPSEFRRINKKEGEMDFVGMRNVFQKRKRSK